MGGAGAQAADLARRLHGGDHLRAGHGGDAEELDVMGIDEMEDGLGGVVVEVAVDDLVGFLSFQGGGEG